VSIWVRMETHGGLSYRDDEFFNSVSYYYYYYYYILNCKWVDTRWQQYGYNLHTNSKQNTKNKTYIAIQKKM